MVIRNGERVPNPDSSKPEKRLQPPPARETLLSSGNDQYFTRKAHAPPFHIGPECIQNLPLQVDESIRRQRRQPLAKLVGHVATKVPEVPDGQRRLDGEAKQAFDTFRAPAASRMLRSLPGAANRKGLGA